MHMYKKRIHMVHFIIGCRIMCQIRQCPVYTGKSKASPRKRATTSKKDGHCCGRWQWWSKTRSRVRIYHHSPKSYLKHNWVMHYICQKSLFPFHDSRFETASPTKTPPTTKVNNERSGDITGSVAIATEEMQTPNKNEERSADNAGPVASTNEKEKILAPEEHNEMSAARTGPVAPEDETSNPIDVRVTAKSGIVKQD